MSLVSGSATRSRGLLGILLGSGILLLLFRQVEPRDVLGQITQADGGRVALAVGFILASYLCRAALWKRLLRTERTYAYGPVFRATMIGYLFNNVLPARLGDVSRGLWLARSRGGSTGGIFGSLALERVLDFSSILVMVGASVWFIPRHSGFVLLGTGILAALIVLFFVCSSSLRRLARSAGWPRLRAVPLIGRLASSLWDHNGRTLVTQLADTASLDNARSGVTWVVLTWIVTLGGLYFALDAVGLALNLGALKVAFILGIASLGFAVPSLPASIGTYQASFVFGAVLAGVPEAQALGASLLYQGLGIAVTTLGGLGSLLWESMSARDSNLLSPSLSVEGQAE